MAVRRRIWQLRQEGLEYSQIAEALNKEGAPRANPDVPWSDHLVGNQLTAYRRLKEPDRKRKREERMRLAAAAPVTEPTPEPAKEPESPALSPSGNKVRLPASIALMLDDPELSTAQKVGVLRAAGKRLPASVQLMLEDAEMSDEERLEVLRILMR